jgi:protein TonB
MTAISQEARRATLPALRFGFSTLASLLLHALVLWPFGFFAQTPAPQPKPVLEAVLLAPLLATQETASEPVPAEPEVKPAPSAVPPAPTSAPRPRELQGRALDTALAAIAKLDFYPREAIERGIEGDVIVLLTLTPNGGVAVAAVATSSGHPILDAAALVAVRGINGLPVGQRQVLLPVRFRLE